MYMSEGRWEDAYNEFFEGFRNYQVASTPPPSPILIIIFYSNPLSHTHYDINLVFTNRLYQLVSVFVYLH